MDGRRLLILAVITGAILATGVSLGSQGATAGPVQDTPREVRTSTGPRVWLSIDPLHLTPVSPQAIGALGGLREALAANGFRVTASAPSDIRVELTGQRLAGGGRNAFPARGRGDGEIALIRATVSLGDELVEVRGRSTEGNRPWRSAAVEVVRGLEQLLAGERTPSAAPSDIAGAVVGASRDQVIPEELLSRIREYVARYQQSFASIVAEEHYRQAYWQRRLRYPSPLHVTRRELRSEMGFTFFPGAGIWFGFRDVLAVDGTTIPNRNRNLQKLFLDTELPSTEQFKQVVEASAKYNIGPAMRNFNVPMTTLLFASPEHRSRCQFRLLRTERLAGLETAVVAFTETQRPTLITRNGHDRPSRGLLWVETTTGRILRTDLAINEDELDARLTTWFAHDGHTEIMVPTKMREVYDYVERLDEYVETLASYTNFRRFQTTTRIKP